MIMLASSHRLGLLLVLLALGVHGQQTCQEAGGECVREDLLRDNCDMAVLPGCNADEFCCIPYGFILNRQEDTCSAVKPPSTCKSRYAGVCRSECPDDRIEMGSCDDQGDCKCCGCKIKSQCLRNYGYCMSTSDNCNGRTKESWCAGSRCTCCIPIVCPEPFIPIGDQCYYFSDMYKNWQEAREACQNMNTTEPADLAVFDRSFGDYDRVIQHVASLDKKRWWIGGSDIPETTRSDEVDRRRSSEESNESSSGTSSEEITTNLTWVDGRPVDLRRNYWVGHAPHHSGQENKLVLYLTKYEKVDRWRVGDTSRKGRIPYICQIF